MNNTLKELVHNRLLLLRNIENLILLRDFQTIYDDSSKVEQSKVHSLVDDYDLEKLREWYKCNRLNQLGILGIRELRTIASRLNIPNFNKLNKALLLSEIVRIQNGSGQGTNNEINNQSFSSNEGPNDQIRSDGVFI